MVNMVDAVRVDRNFQNACSYAIHEFCLVEHFKEQQRLSMFKFVMMSRTCHQTRAPSREGGENRRRIETLVAGN